MARGMMWSGWRFVRFAALLHVVSLLYICSSLFASVPARAAGLSPFRDVEKHWSRQYIERMNAKGLVQGVQRADGLYYEPDRKVTRWEVLVLIIRSMGLEARARTRTEIPDTFKEAASVPGWAKGYVAEAVLSGIISGPELVSFKGDSPATRLQVAAWLGRALGLKPLPSSASQGSQAPGLSFSDIGSLSQQEQETVMKVADAGLMNGYLGMFRPADPVTRAEMAAVLCRADLLLQNELDQWEHSGVLESIGAARDAIVVKLEDGTKKSLALDQNVRVYIEGVAASASTLLPGDHLQVIEDGAGTALYIEATNRFADTEGTLTWLGMARSPAGSEERTVELRLPNGSLRRFRIDPGTVFLLNNLPSGFAGLRPGQRALVEERGGKVVRIRAESQVSVVRGEVRSVVTGLDGNVAITLAVYKDDVRVFTIPAGLRVTRNGKDASVDVIRAGDRARITIHDDAIKRLEVETKERSVSGVLKSVVFATPARLVVSLDQDSRWAAQDNLGEPEASYPVAEGAVIEKDGRTAGLTALRPGDEVTVGIKGDEAVSVTASTAATEVRAVIDAVTISRQMEISVTLRSGQQAAYPLASDVKVRVDGRRASIADLKPGQAAVLKVSAGQVISISVSGMALLSDIRGTVRYVDTNEERFVIAQDDGTERQVAPGDQFVIIRSGEVSRRMADLKPGDVVLIAGRDMAGSPFAAEAVVVIGVGEQ